MNTYTQIQEARLLRKPQVRQTMADYINSAVRKEMLISQNAPQTVIDDEELLLQQRWYELRKWAHRVALDVEARRQIVHALQGLAIERSREYPEVPRRAKTIAIHRIITAGFPGLFTNPDPPPSG